MPAEIWFSIPTLTLLGLCVGSFLNVVIHRLPRMLEREWWTDVAEYQLGNAQAWRTAFGTETPRPIAMDEIAAVISKTAGQLPRLTLIRPRSRCPACGHQIRWYENIPVLGWVMLRGGGAAGKTPH